MKSILHYILGTALFCVVLIPLSRAVEPGFIPLLDRDHTDGWEWRGTGGMPLQDGAWNTHSTGQRGFNHYTKRSFSDFTLRFEYRALKPTSNSGAMLRKDLNDPKQGYEIQLYGNSGQDKPTGTIYGASVNVALQEPKSVPQKSPDEWNEMEIIVVGQRYTVRLNGQLVNEFTGDRNLSGYIGFQSHNKGPVEIRNVRVKDLAGSSLPLAASQRAVADPKDPSGSSLPSGTGQGSVAASNQSLVETLSQQAPNASAWVLAPLDRGVPSDIRQNVTYLREDLLDEAAKKPKASPEAYKIGGQLCNMMIAALDERDRTLANAGFRAVEAQARTGVTSQALEARRNYMMSWPQYAREVSQRAELKSRAINNAAVMAERPKLEWSQRTDKIRPILDALYVQFRAALRQSPAEPPREASGGGK